MNTLDFRCSFGTREAAEAAGPTVEAMGMAVRVVPGDGEGTTWFLLASRETEEELVDLADGGRTRAADDPEVGADAEADRLAPEIEQIAKEFSGILDGWDVTQRSENGREIHGVSWNWRMSS